MFLPLKVGLKTSGPGKQGRYNDRLRTIVFISDSEWQESYPLGSRARSF